MTERVSELMPVMDQIAQFGRKRAAAIGDEFNEGDFIAGVVAALTAVEHPEQTPAWWLLGVVSGRPVFLTPEQHARVVAASEARRQAVAELRGLKPFLKRCLDRLRALDYLTGQTALLREELEEQLQWRP